MTRLSRHVSLTVLMAMLMVQVLLLGLDYLVQATAPHFWWLVIGRLVAGITGASFSAAYAYIADVTPPERRAAAFGTLGLAFGVGFVVGSSKEVTCTQTDVAPPPTVVFPDIEHAAVVDDPRAWSKARKVCIICRSFLGTYRRDSDVVSIVSSA